VGIPVEEGMVKNKKRKESSLGRGGITRKRTLPGR